MRNALADKLLGRCPEPCCAMPSRSVVSTPELHQMSAAPSLDLAQNHPPVRTHEGGSRRMLLLCLLP